MASEQKTRPEVIRVRVNTEERRWLQQIAEEEDRSMSSVLRLALREFYERRVGTPA